jgi:hypothetical protein
LLAAHANRVRESHVNRIRCDVSSQPYHRPFGARVQGDTFVVSVSCWLYIYHRRSPFLVAASRQHCFLQCSFSWLDNYQTRSSELGERDCLVPIEHSVTKRVLLSEEGSGSGITLPRFESIIITLSSLVLRAVCPGVQSGNQMPDR